MLAPHHRATLLKARALTHIPYMHTRMHMTHLVRACVPVYVWAWTRTHVWTCTLM
jgi:hypothetical protein